jgi:hypothetical protein
MRTVFPPSRSHLTEPFPRVIEAEPMSAVEAHYVAPKYSPLADPAPQLEISAAPAERTPVTRLAADPAD